MIHGMVKGTVKLVLTHSEEREVVLNTFCERLEPGNNPILIMTAHNTGKDQTYRVTDIIDTAIEIYL